MDNVVFPKSDRFDTTLHSIYISKSNTTDGNVVVDNDIWARGSVLIGGHIYFYTPMGKHVELDVSDDSASYTLLLPRNQGKPNQILTMGSDSNQLCWTESSSQFQTGILNLEHRFDEFSCSISDIKTQNEVNKSNISAIKVNVDDLQAITSTHDEKINGIESKIERVITEYNLLNDMATQTSNPLQALHNQVYQIEKMMSNCQMKTISLNECALAALNGKYKLWFRPPKGNEANILTDGNELNLQHDASFGKNVNIKGNLRIDGRLMTNILVSEIKLTDKLLDLNVEGGPATGDCAGFQVYENTMPVAHVRISEDRKGWEFKSPMYSSSVKILTDTPLTIGKNNIITNTEQTFSGNKTFTDGIKTDEIQTGSDKPVKVSKLETDTIICRSSLDVKSQVKMMTTDSIVAYLKNVSGATRLVIDSNKNGQINFLTGGNIGYSVVVDGRQFNVIDKMGKKALSISFEGIVSRFSSLNDDGAKHLLTDNNSYIIYKDAKNKFKIGFRTMLEDKKQHFLVSNLNATDLGCY
ncbi:Uncharacterised protein [uncultured archaeon]|nr:Uncharacterised protein [uncultured archaeon]